MGNDLKGKRLMKGITQRKDDKRYVARFKRSYDRKTVQKSFSKYSEAERWLINERYKDQNSIYNVGGEILLCDWNAKWFEIYNQHIRPNTRKYYLNNLKLINESIGEVSLENLKQIHVVEMINNLRMKGYAASRIKGLKSILHNSLQRAVENNYISSNPSVGIKVSFVDEEKTKALTVDQQKAFQKSIKGSHYEQLFLFMLNTGCRISEALCLRYSDIDYGHNTIKVERIFTNIKIDGKYQHVVTPPKTKASIRMVPLNDMAMEQLIVQKKKNLNRKGVNEHFDDLIFVSRSGSTCSFVNINRILHSKVKVLKKQGCDIENLSAHMLRSTFTTRCFEQGLDMATVSKILGHKKIDTTLNIYTTLFPEQTKEEIDKLMIDYLEFEDD